MVKTVVVTGASRGIGRAVTKIFLQHGWRVIGTSRSGVLPLTAERCTAVRLDLAVGESIAAAAERISRLGVNVDVLVNNAAVLLDANDAGIDIGKLRATVEADVIGTIDFTERLLRFMPRGGCIINIDSSYGAFSTPVDMDASNSYRIAKAALNMYTRILAYRLEHQGIKVSSLDPGWVDTDMGNAVATETEKPDRTPEWAADDVYRLAVSNPSTGNFWRFGSAREW